MEGAVGRGERLAVSIVLPLLLAAGLAYALVIPPFQAPDEPAHFYRAVALTETRWFSVNGGQFLPRWSVLLVSNYVGLIRKPAQLDAATAQRGRAIRWNDDSPQFVPPGTPGKLSPNAYTAATYSPLPYLAPAAILLGSEAGGIPPLAALRLARCINLILALALVALAGAIAPRIAPVLWIVAGTPQALHLMSSLSADAITIGSALLLTAALYQLTRPETEPSTFLTIVASLAAALVALSKPNPFLLLPLVLCFRRGRRGALAITFSVLASFAVAATITSLWGEDAMASSATISPRAQLFLLGAEPVKFTGTLLRTWVEYSPRYLEEIVGKLGWLDVFLPGWLVITYLGAMVAISRSTVAGLPPRARITFAAAGAMSLLMIAVTIYMTWNRVGAPLIDGIQGRYFLPVMPLFLLAITRGKEDDRVAELIRTWFPAFLVIAHAIALRAVINRYY